MRVDKARQDQRRAIVKAFSLIVLSRQIRRRAGPCDHAIIADHDGACGLVPDRTLVADNTRLVDEAQRLPGQ